MGPSSVYDCMVGATKADVVLFYTYSEDCNASVRMAPPSGRRYTDATDMELDREHSTPTRPRYETLAARKKGTRGITDPPGNSVRVSQPTLDGRSERPKGVQTLKSRNRARWVVGIAFLTMFRVRRGRLPTKTWSGRDSPVRRDGGNHQYQRKR